VGFPASAEAFIAVASNGGKFAGRMEAQGETTSGMFPTLKETISGEYLLSPPGPQV